MNQLSLLASPSPTTANNNPPVDYYPNWMGRQLADELLTLSLKMDWLHNDWKMMGQSGKLPRKEIIFGDDRYVYSYSRGKVKLTAQPWPEELDTIRCTIACLTGYSFPLVIGNLYEGGHHHIGWHDDGRPELGEKPAIASLSLGATRKFQMRRKVNFGKGKPEVFTYELGHGDLLVMHPGCQEEWAHKVPKTAKQVGTRVNWTFRPWKVAA